MGRHEEHFILDGVDVKYCYTCRRALPTTLIYFIKDKSKWDGISYRCRECAGSHFTREIKEGYKICNKCGRELEMIPKNFHRNNVIKDGYSGTCRDCMGIVDRPIPKEGFKICLRCNRELPATHDYFYYHASHSDGWASDCRECRGAQFAYNVIPKSTKEGYKTCTACGEELPLNEFNKQKLGYLGYRATCKKCRSENRKTEPVQIQRAISHQKRRTFKKNTVSHYTTQDWNDCLTYFNTRCSYCGEDLPLTKDHIIPVSKGGGFVPSNVACACSGCNISKGNRDVFTWFRRQPFYDIGREKKLREFMNCKHGEPVELALF